jgi:hypothetical protein
MNFTNCCKSRYSVIAYGSKQMIIAGYLIDLGIDRDTCFCLGTGENARFLKRLNNDHGFFRKIIPLEHPRFIMQYKSAAKGLYIEKYIKVLTSI